MNSYQGQWIVEENKATLVFGKFHVASVERFWQAGFPTGHWANFFEVKIVGRWAFYCDTIEQGMELVDAEFLKLDLDQYENNQPLQGDGQSTAAR